MDIRIKYEPRDMWIGLYWERDWFGGYDIDAYERLRIFICLIPLFPIIITIRKELNK